MTKQSEVAETYFIRHDPAREQMRHATMGRLDKMIRWKQMNNPIRYERLAAIGKNETQIRLYKKDDVLFCVLF